MILLRKKIVTHLYLEAQYQYISLVVENVMGLARYNIHTSTALSLEGNYWVNERKGGIMSYA